MPADIIIIELKKNRNRWSKVGVGCDGVDYRQVGVNRRLGIRNSAHIDWC